MPKCKHCGVKFDRIRMQQKTCLDPACLIKQGRIEAQQRLALVAKRARQAVKARLDDMRPIQYWLKRAQAAVNALVRYRDRDQPCISCGCTDAVQWHAGHWISVGASSALRFDLANVHRQCHQCNFFEGGRASDYGDRLPARIGNLEYERLKFAPREKRWTREELQCVEAEAKAALKAMKEKNPGAPYTVPG